MSRAEVIRICISVLEGMRTDWVPRQTGNMAYNALQYRIEGDQFVIYISGDGREGIAPYAPYTNEPWTSKRWNGKKNPNEGWWSRFAMEYSRRLARALRGEVL